MAIVYKAIPPFVYLILIFFTTYTKTTNTEEPPVIKGSDRGTFQPGYLFARLLSELTQTKNKLVSCSSSASSSSIKSSSQQQQHASAPTDVLQRHKRLLQGDEVKHANIKPSTTTSQQQNVFQNCESGASQSISSSTNLTNLKLVNVVRGNCEKKDLVSCLGVRIVSRAMDSYSDGVKRDLNSACCKLKYCRDSQDVDLCRVCLQDMRKDAVANNAKQKQKSSRQVALLKALDNISCRNRQYDNMSCSDLNLLAFNLLAGPTSAMEWSEAIKILSKCYPAYDTEIMWLFQDMVGNMSAEDTRMFKDLLNTTLVTHYANQQTNPDQSAAWSRMAAMSDDSVTSQAIQVWHMTPRSVAGIVIVVVLISASLFLGFWAIYQKVKYHFFPDNTIHYSQVYAQDDYPEDEEDDFDENDVYYR